MDGDREQEEPLEDLSHTEQATSTAPEIPANGAVFVALPRGPVIIDPPVAVGVADKETRKELRRKARDKAREKAARNHPAPNVRQPIEVPIRLSDEESVMGVDLPPTKVPLQEQYVGLAPIISSAQSSESCANITADELLNRLNDVLRTTYTIDMPFLREHLEECISMKYDFGMAYALLRPRWFDDFSKLKSILAVCQKEDEKMRLDALDSIEGRITALLRPRRVWDLYANRVVPIWVTRKFPWAISHSWMDTRLRTNIRTPINASQWPVPIPNDSSLERVRIELLNMNADYIWLDILCLRQVGDEKLEAKRKEEWLIDVPTIGDVYHQNQMIVCYYSGLGRPFSIGDLKYDRHWLNRAWTLQEISPNSITAGESNDSPSLTAVSDDPDINLFLERRASIMGFAQEVENIFPVLSVMRERSAVSELDKIAGLAYLLRSGNVPVYVEGRSAEDAWDNLLRTMNGRYLGDLIFLYPYPGPLRHSWAPSWEQINDVSRGLPPSGGVYVFEQVKIHSVRLQDSEGNPPVEQKYMAHHRGYRIDGCRIEGFEYEGEAEPVSNTKLRRTGNVVIGIHNFKVHASHRQTIDKERQYTMVANQGYEYWVVGQLEDAGTIKKHSVLRMYKEDENRLRRLNLGSWQDSEFS